MSEFSKQRLVGLDLVRALAILLVLISHSRYLIDLPGEYAYLSFCGWFGVELFFVLSGYLIGTIILKTLVERPGFYSLLNFWKRRWLRTLPAYFFVLLCICVYYRSVDFRYFLFLQGILGSDFHLFPVSWSLCIEELFYLTFPVVLLLSLYVTKRPHAFIITALLYFIFPVLKRALHFYFFDGELSLLHAEIERKNSFRFDTLAVGALVGYYDYSTRFISKIYKKPIALAVAIGALAMTIAGYRTGTDSIPFTPFYVIMYPVITAISAVSIIILLKMLDFKSLLVRKLILFLSITSYSTYLTHLTLLEEVKKETLVFSSFSRIAIFLSATFLVSSLIYIFVEKPFMKLREIH